MIPWLTTRDLLAATYRLMAQLPSDVDAVVGMARSGLMPGSLVASHLHLPLYAASEERITPVGGGWRSTRLHAEKRRHVILLDDTCCTGRSMGAVLPWVRVAFPGALVETAAVYATPETAFTLNYRVVILPNPHYLEWNFFNSGFITTSAFDMDGILCDDVPPEDDDDGERYVQAIRTARPRYLPRRQPVSLIVTARLEKYRALTTEWLERHGIAAVRLHMGPWPTLTERSQPGAIVRWKAQQYAESSLLVFVESDPRQAEPIALLSGKPVLCPAAGRVFGE